ncbi:hypothetical protein LNQ52_10650 [Klebsiella pneumoniae subsp. pneumoniae]|nr:hypothetical protein [Klebsiella pneumoniae subsp. pneumoniae]
MANAAPGVQPQAATPAAPIVVGEPTATLAEPTAPAAVAENVPQREVKLSFATIAPPPGSIVLRGSRPDASVDSACAAMSWSPTRCSIWNTPHRPRCCPCSRS